jgi:hypothetical protein
MTLGIEMRRPNFARYCSWLTALVLCGLFGGLGLNAAHAEEAQRVLLIAPADAELTARILGQTRDLGVALEVADDQGPQDAQAAAEAGRAHAAAIVVWTEAHGAAGLDLFVLEIDTRELRTRRVSTPEKEALASSTTAEMAALVVRSELSALLSEIKAKRERAQAENAAAKNLPASTSAAAAGQDKAPPPTPPQAPRPWLLSFAYRPSRPFHGTFAHGLALGARRDLAGFALGLSAIGTFPIRLAQAGTEIHLNRLQLRLEGQKRWQVLPSLGLLLGVAASLSIDFRSTKQVQAPLVATGDSSTFSGGFGLLGQLEWQFSRPVGLLLGIGADAVPWRTRFIYQDGGEGGVVARLSWLDVWALVGFFTRFGT